MNKTLALAFMLLLVVLGQSSIAIYLPSLPYMAQHFSVDKSWIQMTVSAYLFGFGFSQLIYGPLSDYFGRRPILLLGLLVFLLASIACALAPSIEFLLSFRLIQGLGAGAASVIARALMRDFFEGRELSQAASYLSMGWALVPIIAPVVGGYLQSYFSWQASFIFLILLASMLIFFAIFRLIETNRTRKSNAMNMRSASQNYFFLLVHKIFISNIACIVIVFSIFVVFNIAGPFLLETQLGLSPIAYGWMLVIISSGYLIGTNINNRIVRRWEPRKVTLGGICFMVFSSSFMLIAVILGFFSITIIVLPMFLIFLSLGFIFANCITACLSPFPHMAGSASALYGFLVFLGGGLLSTAFTRFSGETPLPLAVFLTLASVVMWFIFYLTGRRFGYSVPEGKLKS